MTFTPANAVVWTEIPVTDMRRAMAFYEAALGYRLSLDESGPNPMATFPSTDTPPGVHGHLYPGKPAAPGTGPTVHLAVEGTLEEAIARFEAAGGTVQSPPISIPPGRFVYAQDPDGNSIGLFERAS